MDNELHAITYGDINRRLRRILIMAEPVRLTISAIEALGDSIRICAPYIDIDCKPWHVPYWQRKKRNKR